MSVNFYNHPSQFEPLIPAPALESFLGRSRRLAESALQLQGAAHPNTRSQLRELVRAMNSYYSNQIEGQSTHPLSIERALRADFSSQPEIAQRQRIAIAHIRAEQELEEKCSGLAGILNSEFLKLAHAALYHQLLKQDRTTDDGRVVEPGKWRTENVEIGRHQAPDHASIHAFLSRANEVYSKDWPIESLPVVIACLHQRMAWVHPFMDGNGRACRLQTHAALMPLTGGLWSVSRGFARNRNDYYGRLANADMPRQGDLDGRGNLSEKMLMEWCDFFVSVCEDQVRFMAKMLDLDQLKQRISGLILVRSQQSKDYRREAILPLHHVMSAGAVFRGEFLQLLGLGERTGRKVLSKLLKDRLLTSDTPKGPVGINFPLDSLSYLFPNLYPEAATAELEV